MIIYKVFGVIYTLMLKLIYFNRVDLQGFIFPEGTIKVNIGKNAKLVVIWNISIRNCTQILVRDNASLEIGKGTFINRNCSIVCREHITVGNNVLIGESVKIYDHDHLFDETHIFKDKFSTKKIVIGKNVWIGNNVNILKGSEIIHNTIIGSMSLVNSKLKSAGIYVGIPVKLLKKRGSSENN